MEPVGPTIPAGSKPCAVKAAQGPLISARVNRERVRILTGIFRAIDLHVQRGHHAAPQFGKFALRWRGAFYRSEPSREIRFSAERLRKIYYQRWLRSGRNPDALHHRYGANVPRFSLSEAQRRRAGRLLPGCRSMRQLHRSLFPNTKTAPSETVFLRTFTAEESATLRAAFASRRQSRTVERRFAAWLADPARTFAQGGQA